MKKIYLPLLCLFLLLQQIYSHGIPGKTANASHTSIAAFVDVPAGATVVAGGNGTGSATNQLSDPQSFFVDANANVYVADFNNSRVQKFSPGSTTGVTVAGGNGHGSAANQLDLASSVFVDGAGNVYVADFNNHRIQKWAPGALSGVTVAGGNGQGSAANQLYLPSDIFIDAGGNMYVSDAGNARIQKFAPGSSTGVTVAGGNGFGGALNQFNGVGGIFVDASGKIYATDAGNHRVMLWLPGATQGVVVAGGNGRGSANNQLNNPYGLSFDPDGNLYIADGGNNRIQKWSPNASTGITVAGGTAASQLAFPRDVYVDPSRNLYVLDAGNYRVLKFGSQDIITGSTAPGTTVAAGSYGSAANQIAFADGIFVDGASNIYIADGTNNRIQKWAPDASQGVTVAGGNGAGAAANQLDYPSSVFLDATGNLYVADGSNHRIQKFAPGATNGVTVAGGNGAGTADNQFYSVSDIFVDPAGNIYLSDATLNRVQKWAPGASQGVIVAGAKGLGLAADRLNGPASIFVDASANVYIADANNNRIQRWAPGASEGVTVAGSSIGSTGNGSNVLNNPIGIFVDAAGNIYVTDKGNNRIQKWSPGASAGITVAGGNGEGSAANQLREPKDVFVDTRGLLYVLDASNYRVQRFGADGLGYKYYEGTWTTLPDFNALVPVASGSTANVDISVRPAGRNDNFAFLWEGKINIPAAGTYTFETISDDGSSIYFNTPYSASAAPTLNNDGLHAKRSATATVNVAAAGAYPIAVTFFENTGDEGMQLFWSGPGMPRQPIPNAAFSSSNGNDKTPPTTPANLHLVSKAGNSIALDWDDASDNLGVVAYDIYVGGLYKYSTFESSTVADTLMPNAVYAFSVKARDLAGILSGFSNTVNQATASATGGLKYKYFEGVWDVLPDFSTLTAVKIGNNENVDISVRTPGRNDNFAFVWEGYINIPKAGSYTFETISDDGSKLYFNSLYNPAAVPTVSNDGLHAPTAASGTVNIPAAGFYPISVTFFEKDGGEQMQVYWTGPGISRQLIPNAAFTQTIQPPQNGLTYKYYEGDWNVLPDFSKLTQVKSGTTANVDIGIRPAGRNDHFGFVWQGYINIPTAGNYTFETISDDGSKMYFNSLYDNYASVTVNNDGLHAPASASGSVSVNAPGVYPIAITFFEKDGGEAMQLLWTGPGITRQLVPNSAFVSPQAFPANTVEDHTAVSAVDAADIIKIYPNPFSNSFDISFYNSSAGSDVHVDIYDLNGKLVYTQRAGTFSKGNVSLKVNLDKALIPLGVYMAQLKINGVPSKVVKLIKVK